MRPGRPNSKACEYEGTCADCGQLTTWRSRHFDPHTCSTLELCGSCVPAFLQRQYLPPGCCG